MKFYISTDGYIDQNGGKKGFPFGKKRFGNIIKEYYHEPMEYQREVFLKKMSEYESEIVDNERNDDMTLIGLEIGPKSKTQDIILEYSGVLTQAIISHNIDILEHTIDNAALVGKLSVIVIEITQNMMSYSKSKDINCKDIRPAGYIKVSRLEDIYTIESKNILSIDDKIKIESILTEIKSMNLQKIKKRYRELRRGGENAHEKGGGFGFYEIAKLSLDMDYDFESINEEKYYFKLIVKVKNKKQERE
jgi:hypothetical protein